jgi:hypothetical protein
VAEGFSLNLLSKARMVLRDRDAERQRAEKAGGGAPVDNVAGIMNGSVKLDAAYDQAIALGRGRKRKGDQMALLRKAAPDLAARVDAKELTFEEARTLLDASERDERERRTRPAEEAGAGAPA